MKVHKFGGSSIATSDGIRNMGSIIQSDLPKEMVVVVSAMGKTTNALEEVVHKFFSDSEGALHLLQQIRDRHLQLAMDLGLHTLVANGILTDLLVEAEWLLEDEVQDSFDYVYDQIVSVGELLSSHLVAGYLREKGIAVAWIDARDIIKTDDNYRSANVDWDRVRNAVNEKISVHLDQGEVVITQGFIGSTGENNNSTLGREGSDYSAAILANILDAKKMIAWKDVPGIMTGDPAKMPDVSLIPKLDYHEAINMTFYGAKVIHPKTIRPLLEKNIPLEVKSFSSPVHPGTQIGHFPDLSYPAWHVIAESQALIKLRSRDFSFIKEVQISSIFDAAVRHRIKVNLCKTFAIDAHLIVDHDHANLKAFVKQLESNFEVSFRAGMVLHTICHFKEGDRDILGHHELAYIDKSRSETMHMLFAASESP